MHETAIAQDVHRMCRERMSDPLGRLEHVRVAVGERSAIDPDLLAFAWQAVVANTADADSTIEVEWHPIRPTCDHCGPVRVSVSGWLLPCPDCGAPLRLEGGDELDLLEFSWRTAAQPAKELA